jgi:hypothetical protein
MSCARLSSEKTYSCVFDNMKNPRPLLPAQFRSLFNVLFSIDATLITETSFPPSQVQNPATGQVLANVPCMGSKETFDAIASAHDTFQGNSRLQVHFTFRFEYLGLTIFRAGH